MDGLGIVCCNRLVFASILLFFCEVVETTEEEGTNAEHPDTIAIRKIIDRILFIMINSIEEDLSGRTAKRKSISKLIRVLTF